ncbi:hypothetical protein [Caviibacterium pharyngocola]|nr:hypothetical protein [Caviibacterium pharyngocola]
MKKFLAVAVLTVFLSACCLPWHGHWDGRPGGDQMQQGGHHGGGQGGHHR